MSFCHPRISPELALGYPDRASPSNLANSLIFAPQNYVITLKFGLKLQKYIERSGNSQSNQ